MMSALIAEYRARFGAVPVMGAGVGLAAFMYQLEEALQSGSPICPASRAAQRVRS